MIADRAIMKVKDLRALPIVEVIWRDATSFHGWDRLEGARKDVPDECRTVGRLVRHDRKFVSVAQTVNVAGKVCENWGIPRPWVLTIAVVQRGRRTIRRRARRRR